MIWFLFALLAAVLYSGTILIDKLLLTKYFGKVSELSLTTAAALAGIPLLLIFFLLLGKVPPLQTMATGLVAGWLMLGAFQLYYTALNKSDPALVTSLWQIILPFNLLFGILIFNEHVSFIQIFGMILIAAASVGISLEQKEKKWKLRYDVLLLMTSASLLASLGDVVFKLGAENAPFIELSFAEYTSTVLAGLLLFIFVKKVRVELKTLRKKAKKTISFMQFNEAINLGGTLAIRFALISGPIALVQGVMGTQPFIVLAMVYVLGLFGVSLSRKKKKQKNGVLLREVVAMITVCVGSVLISGALN